MPESTIPTEIRALNLPDLNGAIVIGGAFMELLGLRQAIDIDMSVSKKNWIYIRDELKWSVHTIGASSYMRDPSGRFDIWAGWYDRQHQRVIRFDELISNSQAHEQGFRVPTIEYQIQLKHWEGRQKDARDIKLLQKLVSA
jgi:hypothetical protein